MPPASACVAATAPAVAYEPVSLLTSRTMLSDIIPIGSRPTNAATSTGRTPGSASTVANRPRPAGAAGARPGAAARGTVSPAPLAPRRRRLPGLPPWSGRTGRSTIAPCANQSTASRRAASNFDAAPSSAGASHRGGHEALGIELDRLRYFDTEAVERVALVHPEPPQALVAVVDAAPGSARGSDQSNSISGWTHSSTPSRSSSVQRVVERAARCRCSREIILRRALRIRARAGARSRRRPARSAPAPRAATR